MKRLLMLATVGLGLSAAPPAPAQTVQLCDQNPATFPSLGIPNATTKTYAVQNNFWNAAVAGGTLCLSVNQANGDFQVTTAPGSTPTNGGPAAYPSIFKGCHWGNCTNNSGMPVRVNDLGTANVFWSITPKTSGQWNAALDIWFDTASTTAGQPNGTEIMVWLNHLGPPQPLGGLIASNVSINGTTWNVWQGVLNGSGVDWNVVSYVRVTPASALGSAGAPMDLKPFIADCQARGFLDPNWWLHSIQAGFEPWQNALNLASTGFSATVTAGGGGGTRTLTLNKAGTGGGTVTSSPAGINCGTGCATQNASFANGASVTLTAAAAAGSTFSGWSNGCTGTASTCTVSMTLARTVVATFGGGGGNRTLTLNKAGAGTGTVTSSPAGINCGTGCATQNASFANGTNVTLTAATAAGSTFGGWSNGCTGTASTCTVSMTLARTVVATFGGGGTGSVTVSPVVIQNQPWYHEQAIRISNTAPITALTVTITVQRTPGVSFSGMYNNLGSPVPIQHGNSSTASVITYTFRLAPGQSIGAGVDRTFAAQAGGTGAAHPTAGDTYAVSGTAGGQTFNRSGTF